MSANDIEETNVAATLREIAANCDVVTGKILKKCQESARSGASHILVKVSEEDREYLFRKEQKQRGYNVVIPPITPLVEKLESLGFKLESSDKVSFWASAKCFITISW